MNVFARAVDAVVLGRGRVALLLAMLAVTLVAGWSAARARQEQSNASMASSGSARDPQAQIRGSFGSGETVIVAVTHPRLLGAEGAATIGELTARIAALDGVERVTSLSNVRQIVSGPYGAEPAPLFPSGSTEVDWDEASVRRALDANPHLTGLLVSRDRRTAALVVEVEDRPEDDAYRARLVNALRAMADEPRGDAVAVHVTGITVQKYDTARLVARDQRVLLPLSVAVLATALALATRRPAGVLLPLLVTGVTVVWTLGLYVALGHPINVITSLLPPMLLVLSVTTAIHLFEGWASAWPPEFGRRERLRRLLRAFAAPCFMTALTTAIGLASLAVSEIPAVRLFGMFGAVGILLSFGINFTIVPAVLSYLAPPIRPMRRAGRFAGRLLAATAQLCIRHPWLTISAAAVPTALAVAGLPMIRNNTDLLRFLRQDERLIRDTRFVEAALGGASTIDLIVARRDGKPLTALDDISRLDAFVGAVEREPEVAGTFGLTDLLKPLHRAESGGGLLVLPRTQDQLSGLFDLLDAAEDQTDIRRVMTPDVSAARVNVRLLAIGTREAEALLGRIDAAGRATLGDAYQIVPTGDFYRVTVDSNRLVVSQIGSFALALGAVLVVIGLTLGSWRLLIAAILPNVVPIVWTLGAMGWLGIDLSTATTMVASVVLGIAVDDAIHYLARFRREYDGDLEGAVLRTSRVTGRVLTVTTVVLTLGFWVGTLSSFKPTAYFSWLTAMTMVTALVCTVTLLPACLRVLHAERVVP